MNPFEDDDAEEVRRLSMAWPAFETHPKRARSMDRQLQLQELPLVIERGLKFELVIVSIP